MARIVLLTDRAVHDVLPALPFAGHDVKAEPLAERTIPHLVHLAPSVVVVDAEDNPARGHAVLVALTAAWPGAPTLAVLGRADLSRFAWEEVVDDFTFSGASSAELRLRLDLLARRSGGGGEEVVRLGPLAIDADSYRVTIAGRLLDLTYKEFELLRFLAQRPGRVFTRMALLREVWGYDFYGGTRTVDVHVRRLRAKLGPEHEGLIQTIRGVGYRAAAAPAPSQEG